MDFGVGDWIITVSLLALLLKKESNEDINHILFNLEKILFRNKVLGIAVIDERTLASWGRDIYLGEDDLVGINKKTKTLILSPILVQNLIQSMNNLFSFWSCLKI